jgi:hypothetical protein
VKLLILKLKQLNGGAVGNYIHEIVIGTTNYKNHIKELQKLPGIKKKSDGLFVFTDGPSIRLRPEANNGNQKATSPARDVASEMGSGFMAYEVINRLRKNNEIEITLACLPEMLKHSGGTFLLWKRQH